MFKEAQKEPIKAQELALNSIVQIFKCEFEILREKKKELKFKMIDKVLFPISIRIDGNELCQSIKIS